MHPAHQDISVLIEQPLHVHKRHTVRSRPMLEIGRENVMGKKVGFRGLNGTFFFQFVFHYLNFLRIRDALHVRFLDDVAFRLLLEGHKNDSTSLTFPIQPIDIPSAMFARARHVPFNLSAVERRFGDHVLPNAIDKRHGDEVVTHDPITSLQRYDRRLFLSLGDIFSVALIHTGVPSGRIIDPFVKSDHIRVQRYRLRLEEGEYFLRTEVRNTEINHFKPAL